jgi:hypothetical protein
MSHSQDTVLTVSNPFAGLRPFAFEDSEFFFGRKDQIYALFRLLDRARFVTVTGSSGSGKSSLVRAGLLPLLSKEVDQAGGRIWRWVEMRPGNAPLEGLLNALLEHAPEGHGTRSDSNGQVMRDRISYILRRSSFGISEALEEIGHRDESLLILVDQFEELFRFDLASVEPALDPGPPVLGRNEAAHFVQLLLEASRSPQTQAHVLITMRADFIGDCASFHGLSEAVSASLFLVPDLTRLQREEVIRSPAKKAGATVEPELVERLLNDGEEDTDQLPLLQHCLLRLWEVAGRTEQDGQDGQPTPGRHLDISHYPTIGGMAQALSLHADEVGNSLPGLEPVVERVFRALSERDRGGRPVRRPLRFEQIVAEVGESRENVRDVLDRFRADDCSFLVPAPSMVPCLGDITPIDLRHEVILRRWERLSGSSGSELSSGAPIGWIAAEEQDGRRYRGFLGLFVGVPEGVTPTIGPEWTSAQWTWWRGRRPTEAWASRYGGQFDRVRKLIETGEQLGTNWSTEAQVRGRLFVISPIGAPDSQRRRHADAVFSNILLPAAELAAGGTGRITVLRGDHDPTAGDIMRYVLDSILESEFVAPVVFEANPNVFYEAGIAHAAGRRLLLVKHKDFGAPFDVLGQRYVEYDDQDLADPQYARRPSGPVEQFARALVAEHDAAHRDGRSGNPFNRPEIGALGRERILEHFRDLTYLDWSKMLLNAEQEIWIAGLTLLELANTSDFFFLPTGPEGELSPGGRRNLAHLLSFALGRGVRVTMLMMHPDNPALPAMLIRPPQAPEPIEYEIQKVREDIELSYRRWTDWRTRLVQGSLRELSDLPEELGLLRHAADAWRIIQVRTGIIPQRVTLTEREVVTTPFFCTVPYNSAGPAVRAKAGHPWHRLFHQELAVLAACNAMPRASVSTAAA